MGFNKGLYCILGVLMVLGWNACKQQKKAQTTKVEEQAPRPMVRTATPEELKNVRFVDQKKSEVSPAEVEVPKEESWRDSLIASIQRTPCFGLCPTYELLLFRNGTLIYHGKRNVGRIGWYTAMADKADALKVYNKASEIKYFELEDKYESPVTDMPTTITYLKWSGKGKTISTRFKAPEELVEYQKFFDQVFENKTWVPTENPFEEVGE